MSTDGKTTGEYELGSFRHEVAWTDLEKSERKDLICMIVVPLGKRGSSLRPVKPCPGIPGIHLNAEYTVSMTAALLCGAGALPVRKVSRPLCGSRSALVSSRQIEDHAHSQRHVLERLLWLKNGAQGRRAWLGRARRP